MTRAPASNFRANEFNSRLSSALNSTPLSEKVTITVAGLARGGAVVVVVGNVVVVVVVVVPGSVVVVVVVVVVADDIAETTKVCATPVAAAYVVPAVTLAVSEHVPVSRKVTRRPFTLQTLSEFDATDTVPSPLVVTSAVKLPPTCASEGRFEIVGVVGVINNVVENSVTVLVFAFVTQAVPLSMDIPSETAKS